MYMKWIDNPQWCMARFDTVPGAKLITILANDTEQDLPHGLPARDAADTRRKHRHDTV